MIKRFIAGSVGAVVGALVAMFILAFGLGGLLWIIAEPMGFGWPADWAATKELSDREASIINEGIKGLLGGGVIVGAVYGARWAARRVGGIAKKS